MRSGSAHVGVLGAGRLPQILMWRQAKALLAKCGSMRGRVDADHQGRYVRAAAAAGGRTTENISIRCWRMVAEDGGRGWLCTPSDVFLWGGGGRGGCVQRLDCEWVTQHRHSILKVGPFFIHALAPRTGLALAGVKEGASTLQPLLHDQNPPNNHSRARGGHRAIVVSLQLQALARRHRHPLQARQTDAASSAYAHCLAARPSH